MVSRIETKVGIRGKKHQNWYLQSLLSKLAGRSRDGC